jgi:hypothetical protein
MRLVKIVCAAAAAAAAALLLPAGATAKELASARACGAGGDCRTISDPGRLAGMIEGAPATAPHAGAPFYRVRMTIAHAGEEVYRFTVSYVPSSGLLLNDDDGNWMHATPRGRRGFDRLVRGLEPLPGGRLRGIAPAPFEPPAPASAPADDGGGTPWTLLAAAVAAAAIAAAAAFALRRRPATAP